MQRYRVFTDSKWVDPVDHYTRRATVKEQPHAQGKYVRYKDASEALAAANQRIQKLRDALDRIKDISKRDKWPGKVNRQNFNHMSDQIARCLVISVDALQHDWESSDD